MISLLTQGWCLKTSESLEECLDITGKSVSISTTLMLAKSDFLLPVSYSSLYPLTRVHTGQCNQQRSTGMLNTSGIYCCFELTCMFQLLLEMFHENNIASQGCSALLMFVPGLVRIVVFTQSEAVSSFKQSPLIL